MNNEKYKSTIGFTDLLFNILVGFAFLFIIAFLLIKPEAKKEDFERKAEFVVVMEWDHDQPDDIDLYVQDPTNSTVHFRLPITNFMYLDKDDLGYANDIVKNVDGTITKVNINREVVTIRGIIPGEYIINAQCKATKNIFKLKKIPFREITFNKRNEDELGEIFTFFVLETILLSRLMNINPFDQPAVEQVKIETKRFLR